MQGGPLSAKLFNILVDAVAREWYWQLGEESELEEETNNALMETVFAVFYVDNVYLASWDPKFLQRALTIHVCCFARVGLETNVSKTQTMICMPGRIRTQLPVASYDQIRRGVVLAKDWDSQKVQYHQCNKMMGASSLYRHLADQHKIYQQIVVTEELLGARAGVTYQCHPDLGGGLTCPVPECAGNFYGGWMLFAPLQRFTPYQPDVTLNRGVFSTV